MKRLEVVFQGVEDTYGDDDVLQLSVVKVWTKLSTETSYRVELYCDAEITTVLMLKRRISIRDAKVEKNGLFLHLIKTQYER